MKKRNIIIILLLFSMVANGVLVFKLEEQPWHIDIANANSRDTYFTIHNVKQAQNISRGKGIKVGILDHYFGYQMHKELYKNAVDFLNNSFPLNKVSEHGYWMATTLKEIAPECEIYALNTLDSHEDKKVDAMIKAIDWAIDNHIDVLTYSEAPITERNRQRLDNAVNKAVKNNIVTTFIHYDNPNNIWPNGMFSNNVSNNYKREPDLNILNYDYNSLRMNTYQKYRELKNNIAGGDNIPYFSLSSTSPVTAGFVAILKGINNKLSPSKYKEILIKTSYKMTFKDPFTLKEVECGNVADISKAVTFLKENYK